MPADDESSVATPTYSTRDLVILANAKLDSVVGDVREIRDDVGILKARVSSLETKEAVREASGDVREDHENKYFTKRIHFRNTLYGIAVLLAYWFGPIVDNWLQHKR